MSLSIVAAMTDAGVIGKEGTLPWRLSADLQRFKAITMGHPIVMGRKTWDSLPRRPLPGRRNLVLSRQEDLFLEGAERFGDLEAALGALQGEESFVIGGRGLFEAALPKAERLYLTLIHYPFDGDVHFPSFKFSDYATRRKEAFRATEGWDYEFLDLERIV